MNKPDTKTRQLASIVPYRKHGDAWFFYLQRRDGHAKRSPHFLGLFGGGIEEGETPEEAMLRETEEELCIVPEGYWFFKTYYPSSADIAHVYAVEGSVGFEQTVTVCEGEYGRFFSIKQIEEEPLMLPWVLGALEELSQYLDLDSREL